MTATERCDCARPLVEGFECVRCGRPWDSARSGPYRSATHRADPRRERSIGRDKEVHSTGRSDLAPRTCKLCRRSFRPTRSDQEYHSKRCVRLAHRERAGDPTVAATIAWVRNPPACEGCGEPLWDTRVGARVHGDTCRKRAQRRLARQPGDVPDPSSAPARS